jgi:hypothetical protein
MKSFKVLIYNGNVQFYNLELIREILKNYFIFLVSTHFQHDIVLNLFPMCQFLLLGSVPKHRDTL